MSENKHIILRLESVSIKSLTVLLQSLRQGLPNINQILQSTEQEPVDILILKEDGVVSIEQFFQDIEKAANPGRKLPPHIK